MQGIFGDPARFGGSSWKAQLAIIMRYYGCSDVLDMIWCLIENRWIVLFKVMQIIVEDPAFNAARYFRSKRVVRVAQACNGRCNWNSRISDYSELSRLSMIIYMEGYPGAYICQEPLRGSLSGARFLMLYRLVHGEVALCLETIYTNVIQGSQLIGSLILECGYRQLENIVVFPWENSITLV